MDKPKRFPVGMYQLKGPVKNPSSDRRKKGDWMAPPAFATGERFYVRDFPANNGFAPDLVKLGYYGSISTTSPTFKALEPLLEPVVPTASERLRIHDVSCREVLVRMIESGAVSMEMVLTVHALLEKEWEERDNAPPKEEDEA